MAEHRRTFIPPADDLLLNKRTYDDGPEAFKFNLQTNAYQLRPIVISRTHHVTSCDDADQSGTYDPRDQQPRSSAIAIRTSRAPRANGSGAAPSYGGNRERTMTWLYGRHIGYSEITTLKFCSEVGKKLFKDIAVNWPEKPRNDAKIQNPTEISLDFLQDSRLRKRNTLRNGDFAADDTALKETLCGHPAARGCISCAHNNSPCSLLSNGFKYPCQRCEAKGCDCKFFTQPKLKAGCLHCRAGNFVCSYCTSDENHASPCKRCQEKGMSCLAGPKDGSMRQGRSYDVPTPYPILSGTFGYRSSTATLGTASARAKKSTHVDTKGMVAGSSMLKAETPKSIKGKNGNVGKKSMAASSRIRKARARKPVKGKNARGGSPITPGTDLASYDQLVSNVTTQFTTNAALPEDAYSAFAPDMSTTNTALEPRVGGIPPILQIPLSIIINGTRKWTTSQFPHPMHFRAGQSCSFWPSESFAILGLGKMTVEVYDCGSGKPYYPIPTGPSAHSPTLMCHDCTDIRMMTALCQGHEFIDVKGGLTNAQAEAMDYRRYLQPQLEPARPFEWCSLCVFPAKVGCCNEKGKVIHVNGVAGCGLHLCESCEANLKEVCEGNLDELITMMREREEEDGLELRADLEFLQLKGHLMTRLFAAVNGLGEA